MEPINDAELLKMINSSKTREKGFRILVETYQRNVYGIARKMVIFHEDADDIVQNTFIKAFRNIQKFNQKSTLFTWIYRIAVNESLNFIEKKKRMLSSSLEDYHEKMENHVDQSPLIDGNVIELRLQKAILKLPTKQRLIFNLRYFDELPYEEMSKITETSVGSLKAGYHHAVKKVEEFLTQD
jgi:RNA polymerase sigma-70 factor (ECF subfamily)